MLLEIVTFLLYNKENDNGLIFWKEYKWKIYILKMINENKEKNKISFTFLVYF